MNKTLTRRIFSLILILFVVLGIFAIRLIEFQVVKGEELLSQAVNTRSYKFPVTAARGEIVDKFGRPLATNRTGYNVTLNQLMLPKDNLNSTLIELVEILSSQGDKWNDRTPITMTEPYTFTGLNVETGISADADNMKKQINLAAYATEQQVLDKLVQMFKLENLPKDQQRIIGGIRYQMMSEGYGAENTFTLASDVSATTVATIKERSLRLPGVEIVSQSSRTYPDGTIMPHIMGLVGPIFREEWQENEKELKANKYKQNSIKGNSGLELAFESQLRGTDGVLAIERTLTGELRASEMEAEPKPGNTVMLTLDSKLQQDIYASLERSIRKMQEKKPGEGKEANAGAVVVLDVKTGGVLAVVNFPSYDLNLYSSNYDEYVKNPDKPLLNRALRGLYRPGSAFKPLVGLTGLLNGTIGGDFKINCTGVYNFYTQYGYTGNDLAAHGNMNIQRAIEQSCNVFFYDVGRQVGIDAFNEVANKLGLAVQTGVEVYEETGYLTNEATAIRLGVEWNPLGDTCQAAIGQKETMVTPIQLATYAMTLANRGVRYKTHFVSSIRDYNSGAVIEELLPEVVSELPDNNNAYSEIEAGMVLTAQTHSGGYLTNYPYTIALKTGTAETGKLTAEGKKLYNASMVAYGPVENPELAIGIVVENGNYGYQLAEIVKDIFDSYYVSRAETMSPQKNGELLH